ncbi:sulfite exporter TauE/SafE family protein [Steroidobacter sp. S1-65]|uniref:Sulfite exporter TauE/SafE family protein n=1 Tax=Steroidobacter gossypii TaxID=2805490 RepID=A0ABS1X4L9_9GAMM|nr:sulfite exporter TauE/SafE family protein [Steroidobacter gossypii]MBM0108169.1 sulfite exporter TauE/SafE family protein [Steroidobacter gossypii]
MSGVLTVGAAALLGLVASGHCVVMCGGISTALGLATAKDRNGRPRAWLLIHYQLGRITSYALAGLLFASMLGGFVAALDIEVIGNTLRALSALTLLLAALVTFGHVGDPGTAIGRRVWPKIAKLGRPLLPVTSMPRAFAFGSIWGWMPCGFVYTVLLIATLQLDALYGAITMAAFGLGTAPALLMTAFGAQRVAAFAAKAGARHAAGSVLLASAVLTLFGPGFVHMLPGLHGWLPFDCG